MWLFLLFFYCLQTVSSNGSLIDDVLICYNGTSFEECPIFPYTGFFPFCIYMRTPSTMTKRGRNHFGCVYSRHLPPECLENGRYYIEWTTVKLKKKNISGAMMCCSDNYCNQRNDLMLTMVRISDRNEENIWQPILMVLVFLACCILPVIYAFIHHRHMEDSQRMEGTDHMKNYIKEGFSKDLKIRMTGPLQKMNFSNYQLMSNIIKEMSFRYRYHSGSSHVMDSATSAVNMMKEPQSENISLNVSFHPVVDLIVQDTAFPGAVRRQEPTRFIHLAEKMIEHGPYRFKFDPVELGDVFEACVPILRKEHTLLKLPEEGYHVYGNLEGSYGDLFRWFHYNGWPPKQKVIFLGGLSHPEEEYSLETVALIFSLKAMLPNHVFILRGPSEVHLPNWKLRMPMQVATSMAGVVARAYQFLPLAALVGGNILLCHGGVSHGLSHIRQIDAIKRPLKEIRMGSLEADLIFSKAGRVNDLLPGARGSSFSPDWEPSIYTGLPNKHQISQIIRARNICQTGFMIHNNQIITISSVCNSDESRSFDGASIYIDSNLVIKITRMTAYNPHIIQEKKMKPAKKKIVQNAKKTLVSKKQSGR